MRALLASELLDVWEWGLGQQPIEWALTLLAVACPEVALDTLAKLTISERDALLLTLREWTFGPQVVSLAPCPACGEYLELNFNADEIRVSPKADSLEPLSLNTPVCHNRWNNFVQEIIIGRRKGKRRCFRNANRTQKCKQRRNTTLQRRIQTTDHPGSREVWVRAIRIAAAPRRTNLYPVEGTAQLLAYTLERG